MLTMMPSAARTLGRLEPFDADRDLDDDVRGGRGQPARFDDDVVGAATDTHSTLTGPGTIRQISAMSSSNFRFSFEQREGLVVTPSTIPQLASSRISSRFAVSRKNFMSSSSRSVGFRRRSRDPAHDLVRQRPDALDLDVHPVARLHRARRPPASRWT